MPSNGDDCFAFKRHAFPAQMAVGGCVQRLCDKYVYEHRLSRLRAKTPRECVSILNRNGHRSISKVQRNLRESEKTWETDKLETQFVEEKTSLQHERKQIDNLSIELAVVFDILLTNRNHP